MTFFDNYWFLVTLIPFVVLAFLELRRNRLVQEQVEYVEPTEHSTFLAEKRS